MDPLEQAARQIAERGREALLERLRPAFEEAAAAHADVLQIDPERLESMIQRGADRADGLQWRRALAGVAAEQLGLGLGEALGHPAVARAQEIIGAPSYEDSLAELTSAAPSAAETAGGAESAGTAGGAESAETGGGAESAETAGGAESGGAARSAREESSREEESAGTAEEEEPARALDEEEESARTAAEGEPVGTADEEEEPAGAARSAREGESADTPPSALAGGRAGMTRGVRGPSEGDLGAPLASASPGLAVRLPAVHLGGIANLAAAESGLALRFSEHGLQIFRGEHSPALGRVALDEISALEVSTARSRRRRGQGAQLVVRTEQGEASFKIPGVSTDELRTRLAPVRERIGKKDRTRSSL